MILVCLPSRADADNSLVTVTGQQAGATPFITTVSAHMINPSQLDHVQFTIAPKTGSVTRAISARYSLAYLTGRGFVDANTGIITLPVFGLYADYTNAVTMQFAFVDGTSETKTLDVATAKYRNSIYKHPGVVQARTATALSYDFILLKTTVEGPNPKIIDTDGEVRWVGTDPSVDSQFLLRDNSIFCVGTNNTSLQRLEFDGTLTNVADYASSGVTSFNHNFDYGKTGILSEVNTTDYNETVVMETDLAGNVLHTWNMATIISAAMTAGGDDPTQFVAAAGSQVDWFHTNCATYRPSDDSVVISSREDFVIALDYETGAIKWIFGDPTKQWAQFPSLKKYALTATPGSKYPLGQHALSFVKDRLLLFDDGYGSLNHTPAGKSRKYSAPRKYAINQAAGTATEVWNYYANPPIYSPITSSVYEDQAGNYLIDYATAGPYLNAEIIGLAPSGEKVFDYTYPEVDTAQTDWNSVILHLENLVFD